MSEEWVELTDGNRKIVITRRELTNLAHRISRIFAHAKRIKPPVENEHLRGNALAVVPVFMASTLRSPELHTGGNGDGAALAGPGARGQSRRPRLKQ